MRRLISFACAGETLVATLDIAEGNAATGVLIVSGGNEVRVGPGGVMAWLGASLAALGVPVLRFDRRGVGDSGGENRGYASAGPDIRAALAAFRAAVPTLRQVVAFGNCDAARALMLEGAGLGVDALVLGNPWVADEADGLPPAAAIRRRYADRLRGGAALRDLLRGRIALAAAWRGVAKIVRGRGRTAAIPPPPAIPVTLILARGDATAIGFSAHWRSPAFAAWRGVTRVVPVAGDAHGFTDAREALLAGLLGAVDAAG